MYNHIAVELIPRDLVKFEEEIIRVKKQFPEISLINIPDLKRLNYRSWEAANIALKYYSDVVPHIRAIDFDLTSGLDISDYLINCKINKVLVVTGDLTLDEDYFKTSALDLIRYFKSYHPNIEVYATIDPYRSNLKDELDYIKEKQDAGVDGFFTQPFFDIHLLKTYLDLLSQHSIFYGISPVNSQKSREYWENMNNVVFPKHFNPVCAWNVQIAKEAMKMIKDYNQNLYFMPIRDEVCQYLSDVFNN